MQARGLTPILNVSDIQASFAWFEKLGWRKGWDWGDPPTFGGVCSGTCEIFLCQGAQGGRGRGPAPMTFGPEGDEVGDRGVWMSLWVDDVDAVHAQCLAAGLEVTWPPTDMPWNVREMHVRHPDGHVFRVSRGIEHAAPPESFTASTLAASLTVNDLPRSLAWYRDVVGFAVEREHEREGRLRAVSLRAGSVRILLGQDDGAKGWDRAKGEGFSLRLTTPERVDDVAQRILARGGTLESEPVDTPWGARMFRVRDPDGFRLTISSE